MRCQSDHFSAFDRGRWSNPRNVLLAQPVSRVRYRGVCHDGVVSAIGDEQRAEAQEHILDHALGEVERIEKLSRIREFVLGAQDGLLVPLGVVTGMAAANPGQAAILVAGFAEAVAGSIAMGGGSYLASEAEEGLYVAEISDEREEIVDHFDREVAELALILEQEGLPRESAEQVALGLAANPEVFLRTKVQKELGISADAGGAALGDALVVGLTYLCAAIIPLWPYVFFGISTALPISLFCTFVALFALSLLGINSLLTGGGGGRSPNASQAASPLEATTPSGVVINSDAASTGYALFPR